MLKQGIYEEIINTKLKDELNNIDENSFIITKENIDVEEARKILSNYISNVTRKALKYIRESKTDDKEALISQIKTCNDIISILSDNLDEEEFNLLKICDEGEVLTSIYSKLNNIRSIKKEKIIKPISSISQSSLFTGSHYEPDMLSEIKKEINSCDSVDMLVSFIKWSGLRCIIEELKDLTENRKGKLRVITTSYMEATDYKAIIELSKLQNTEI